VPPQVETETAPPPLRLEWRSPAELAENPANWRRHPEIEPKYVAVALERLAGMGLAPELSHA
jgi:hypothetical protein